MVQAGYDYSNWEYQYIPETTREDRRVQKKKRVKSNSRKNFFLKFSIIALAYAFLLVYLCIRSATLGYEIVNLEKEIQGMETANQRMEYAIAQKTSLDVIEKRATQELSMFSPGSEMSYAVAATAAITDIASAEKMTADPAGEKPLEKLYAGIMLLTEKNNL